MSPLGSNGLFDEPYLYRTVVVSQDQEDKVLEKERAIDDLQAKIDEAIASLKMAESEKHGLQKSLDDEKAAAAEHSESLDKMREELEESQKLKTELESQAKDLEDAEAAANAEKKEIEENLAKSSDSVKKLEDKAIELELEQAVQAKVDKAEADVIKAQAATLQKELERKREAIAAKEKELLEVALQEAKLRDEIDGLNGQTKALDRENKSLELEVESLKVKLAASETSVDATVKAKESELVNAAAEKDRLVAIAEFLTKSLKLVLRLIGCPLVSGLDGSPMTAPLIKVSSPMTAPLIKVSSPMTASP
jgi:chromosome segregation ATPase